MGKNGDDDKNDDNDDKDCDHKTRKNLVDFQTLRLVARGQEQMKLKILPLMVIFMEDLIF